MLVPATSNANVPRMNVIINCHHCCTASVPCHANKTRKGKYSNNIFFIKITEMKNKIKNKKSEKIKLIIMKKNLT